MAEWKSVATLDQIPNKDEGLSVDVGDNKVGIFRLDDQLYAIHDVCPHAYALLSQGFVDGSVVECCLHGAEFDIPTGRVLKGPAERDLRTFRVRVDNKDIQVLDE